MLWLYLLFHVEASHSAFCLPAIGRRQIRRDPGEEQGGESDIIRRIFIVDII